jgi:hypothetical protein
MVMYKDKFFKLHYYSVLLIGLVNFFGFLFELSKTTVYQALKQKPAAEYTIYSDWPNQSDSVVNDFSFGGKLSFRYLAENYEKDSAAIDQNIKTAAANPQAQFLLIQKINYLRNKSLFDTGFRVQPVLSSNSKELYLIQRMTP